MLLVISEEHIFNKLLTHPPRRLQDIAQAMSYEKKEES